MIIYPAIDILDGKPVRLGVGGDFSTVQQVAQSPLEAAKRYVAEGAEWLHVVDLNGSRTGVPENLDHIRQIANRYTVKIQAGGGIRDFDTAEAFAEAGVSRVVVGTAAISDPELIGRLVDRHADGLAVAVDSRDGKVATSGWTETSSIEVEDLVQKLAVMGVSTINYTNIAVDGSLEGVDLDAVRAVARAFGGDLIYSGGVGSLADITGLVNLRHRGVRGVIVGRALHSGRFTLPEAIAAANAAASSGAV